MQPCSRAPCDVLPQTQRHVEGQLEALGKALHQHGPQFPP